MNLAFLEGDVEDEDDHKCSAPPVFTVSAWGQCDQLWCTNILNCAAILSWSRSARVQILSSPKVGIWLYVYIVCLLFCTVYTSVCFPSFHLLYLIPPFSLFCGCLQSSLVLVASPLQIRLPNLTEPYMDKWTHNWDLFSICCVLLLIIPSFCSIFRVWLCSWAMGCAMKR